MKKVVVYTAPGCTFCLFAENFLKQNKIPFEEIDISKDESAKKEMIKISGQQNVPVLKIGKEVLVGYDIKKIKAALEI